MFPFFREGDKITIKTYGKTAPMVGDIVVFLRNGQLVLHRLIRISKSSTDQSVFYLTKGDNYRWADGPITLNDILGRAVRISRRGRNIRLDSYTARLGHKFIADLSWAGFKALETLRLIKSLVKGI